MPDINKAYSWAIETCNAPNIGYSQTYRAQQTVNGITYYDCSSFIWYALIAGGFDCAGAAGTTYPMTTANEPSVLEALGFTRYDPTAVEWLPGDIVHVRNSSRQHTEMVYQGYITMGAHTSNRPLADQVSINSSPSEPSSYANLYRFGDGGAVGYGSSAYVVAAIAGNFWQESNINPGIWEGLEVGTFEQLNHGYGLGQWTNTGGDTHGRLYQLYSYLTENNYALDSGDGQMAFLVEENTWYPTEEAASFENLQAFLTSDSTDLELLTHAWNIGWEGIHDDSWDLRVQHAQVCYNYIVANANNADINAWIAGNRYLTQDEILNNAVMLYRWLGAGGGGGGAPGTAKRKGFKPWMIKRIF